jgi:hypothetical protein
MEGRQPDAYGYGMMPFNGHADSVSGHGLAMLDPRFAPMARHREAILETNSERHGKRGGQHDECAC